VPLLLLTGAVAYLAYLVMVSCEALAAGAPHERVARGAGGRLAVGPVDPQRRPGANDDRRAALATYRMRYVLKPAPPWS